MKNLMLTLSADGGLIAAVSFESDDHVCSIRAQMGSMPATREDWDLIITTVKNLMDQAERAIVVDCTKPTDARAVS